MNAETSYAGPERRRNRVFVTKNTEYHFRGDRCVAVRDRRSSKWLPSHLAIGRRLSGGVHFHKNGAAVPVCDLPSVGEALYFADDGRAIPNFINQALHKKPITLYGDGSQTRSFCYIDDLINGLYKLLMSTVNEPVNIGNPDEMTLLEMAQTVRRLTRSASRVVHRPLPQDDPKVRRPDIRLAKRKLHWEPRVSFDQGLAQTIAYFRKSFKHA